ncbi:MAG TPA: hypothetical protein VD995_34220 [Azospirillum sp.]|nr:hypothetical protein [Azospirillum sp.]
MNPVFVYTPGGYINANRIETARFNKDGRHSIVVDGVVVDSNHVDFGSLLVSLTPVSGEWECLTLCGEEDGTNSVWAEPVIAWGLTMLGEVVPVTPSERTGNFGNPGLRKVGTAQVHVSGFATYKDADAWLAAEQEAISNRSK